jgi:hypothetical protein
MRLMSKIDLFETQHKKQLTADDADFADLTLISLLKSMVELQKIVKLKKSALNQQNQRHRRLEKNVSGFKLARDELFRKFNF